MTGLLTAASVAVTLAGGVIYLLHTRRETRPELVSWVIWTFLAGILVTSSAVTGRVPAAAFVAADGIMGAATVAVVLRRGDWSLGLVDWACAIGAAVALALLTVARSPAAATVAAIAADWCACMPTLGHAWKKPREEPWLAFAGWAAGGMLALAAALPGAHHEITAVGPPAYLLLANGAVAVVILARRPQVPAADGVALAGTSGSSTAGPLTTVGRSAAESRAQTAGGGSPPARHGAATRERASLPGRPGIRTVGPRTRGGRRRTWRTRREWTG